MYRVPVTCAPGILAAWYSLFEKLYKKPSSRLSLQTKFEIHHPLVRKKKTEGKKKGGGAGLRCECLHIHQGSNQVLENQLWVPLGARMSYTSALEDTDLCNQKSLANMKKGPHGCGINQQV